ncbi:MAG: hypothetical protein R3C52_12925 [Hyphomonadaceae bacterium]
MSRLTASLAVIAGALCACMPAAGAAYAQSPTGRWTFQTGTINDTCDLSGDMKIWQESKDGPYKCRFTSVQECKTEPPLRIEMAQTCVAKVKGQSIEITSAIDKALDVSPPDLKEAVRLGYAPDNFKVELNKAGTEMTGTFHSLTQALVKFRRAADLTS